CARNNQALPCASFNRAYHVAHQGEVVAVGTGTYPATGLVDGATTINPDSSKRGPVFFECQGNGDVTFAAPVFAFFAGSAAVAVRGGCFHFHIPTFGYGGYSARTH